MLWEQIKNRMLLHSDQIIEEKENKLTYREMIVKAEQLAQNLASGRYAIRCSSELHTGLAILACFAAGVTAIPLSSRYGNQHCERILKLTAPHYTITDSIGNLSVQRCEMVDITAPDANCALIMCTSGTTGTPKGAMITEKNLWANLSDIDRYFDLRCSDTILITRPLYHCAVLTGEFLISLFRGVHIRFYTEAFNPVALAKQLQNNVTVTCATPTLLTLLARVANRVADHYPLRLIVSSGERMTKESAQSIRRIFPNARIMNVYGLTEASPRVAYLPPELFDSYPEFVGFPLHSIAVKIVNDNNIEVPRGVEGELIVQGPSIMSGYYRAQNETQNTLRNGWLHTGDIAHMDKDGKITIRCRKDDMIIIAGMNIYPQEIENALCKDKRITEVLAYNARDNAGHSHIAVRIVADGLTKENIFEICHEQLPAYEQPTIVEIVDRLPRNASGKILRPKGAVKI